MTSDDYEGFLSEILDHSRQRMRDAQAALNEAEQARRINAVIAVRAGYGKTRTASKLGVSRPTLDAWIKAVEADAEDLARVEQHERFVASR